MKCDQTMKHGWNSAVAEEEYLAGFISLLSLLDNCIQSNCGNLLTLGRSFGVSWKRIQIIVMGINFLVIWYKMFIEVIYVNKTL